MRKRGIKSAIAAGLSILFVFLLAGCGASKLQLVEKDSCFNKVYLVSAQEVALEYTLVVKNSSREDKTFTIRGNFKDDVKAGIITQADLTGTNSQRDSTVFTVKAKSTETYTVLFVGKFDHTIQKKNTKLPAFQLEEAASGNTTVKK